MLEQAIDMKGSPRPINVSKRKPKQGALCYNWLLYDASSLAWPQREKQNRSIPIAILFGGFATTQSLYGSCPYIGVLVVDLRPHALLYVNHAPR